jgi:uncharacterized lipoprotein
MKKQFIFLVSVIVLSACSQSKSDHEAEDKNSATHAEQYSEENISPQLQNNQDSNSRLEIDTISSSKSAVEERRPDSLELNNKDK